MKEQKVVITSDAKEINDLIANGWKVTLVTAQHVAIDHGTMSAMTIEKPAIRGYFCFLLEK